MKKENLKHAKLEHLDHQNLEIAVIGAGEFGYAMADYIAKLGYEPRLYDKDKKIMEGLTRKRRNPKHFTNIILNQNITPEPDLEKAVQDASLIIVAVPSKYVREAARQIKPCMQDNTVILSLAKGLEAIDNTEARTPTQAITEELQGKEYALAVLSGGMLAKEFIKGQDDFYATIASQNNKVAKDLKEILRSQNFHLDTWDDPIGVELAGAFKNVVAITAGMGHALGKAHSSICGFISAYSKEMEEIAIKLGAQRRETYSIKVQACGGDLMTTCFGQSRNRGYGIRIVEGRKEGLTPKDVLEEMRKENKTVEGYETTRAFYQQSQSLGLKSPLITQNYKVLYENKDPEQAIETLKRLAGRIGITRNQH